MSTDCYSYMDARNLCSPRAGLVAVVGSQLACVGCGQEMGPPRTILQCSYGHNLCGPCAQDSEVGHLFTCKTRLGIMFWL